MSAPHKTIKLRREKQTRWSVRVGDAVSKAVITIGGIGTILAVSLVFVFLGYVVLPLFQSAKVSDANAAPIAWGNERIAHMAIDEYRTLGWTVGERGTLTVFRADTREILDRKPLFPDAQVTALSFHADGSGISAGFADGSVRIGTIDVASELLNRKKYDAKKLAALDALTPGDVAAFDGGIAVRLPQNDVRCQKIQVAFKDPIKIAGSAIKEIDHYIDDKRNVICVLSDDNKLTYTSVRRIVAIDGTERLKPGKKTVLDVAGRRAATKKLLLTGIGDGVLIAWEDGGAARFDCREPNNIQLAEELNLLPDREATLTSCELLLGRVTVIAGDSRGRTQAWFPIRPAPTIDNQALTVGHNLPSGGAAVTTLAMSARNRMVLAGYKDGSAKLIHVTTEQTVADIAADDEPTSGADPLTAVAIAPKDDGLYAATANQLWSCHLDPMHPEVSTRSLFLPVHYELASKPEFVWQSGGGSSDLEPKLSLTPLIFGTLKATIYSMLFGAPLALLAAIYTSEFLKPKTKAKVKPTIELMASLPSVVLGFLAALVIARIVERHVPEILSATVTIPLCVVLGAFLWQIVPQKTAILYRHWRLPLVFIAGVVGVALAMAIGPAAERILFAGDIKAWLDGQTVLPPVRDGLFAWLAAQPQGGAGAWFLVLVPASALFVSSMVSRYVNPRFRIRFGDASQQRFALMNLAKFLVSAVATIALAYVASVVFNAVLFDPRGKGPLAFVSTYDQRNSLVVGFIMGFAIIPIIYTIADDALSTVPDHLRSASLGAGATAWQTATRIVIPTAMSGLFSALMIGLGRAVGETMIVLMAAGATPIMEMNLFNGFRTLSANIATELPEATRDSSHYRTLFLAALVLFVMTFIVNTAAEVVRARFRRRAYQL